jgi:hypothetical protein
MEVSMGGNIQGVMPRAIEGDGFYCLGPSQVMELLQNQDAEQEGHIFVWASSSLSNCLEISFTNGFLMLN